MSRHCMLAPDPNPPSALPPSRPPPSPPWNNKHPCPPHPSFPNLMAFSLSHTHTHTLSNHRLMRSGVALCLDPMLTSGSFSSD